MVGKDGSTKASQGSRFGIIWSAASNRIISVNPATSIAPSPRKALFSGNHEFVGALSGRFINFQALHHDLYDRFLVGRVVQPAHRLSHRPIESREQAAVLGEGLIRGEVGGVEQIFNLVGIVEQNLSAGIDGSEVERRGLR